MYFVSTSTSDTIEFCKQICHKIVSFNGAAVIILNGDLGSGKTFISSNIIKILSGNHNINAPSPTFSIVLHYKTANNVNINHYDLYRIKTKQELESIGFYESLFNSITIIEWPEICGEYIAKFRQVNQNLLVIDADININDKSDRIISYSCN